MALIDTPEAANRLARAIASDVSLYNEAKIKEGIENDTFFSILSDELEEGRAHYRSRVAPESQCVAERGFDPPVAPAFGTEHAAPPRSRCVRSAGVFRKALVATHTPSRGARND